jgi:amphi-Trp domain-containing protein
MGRETVLFKSEEKKSRDEVVEILRLLAEKIASGRLNLSNDSGSVELELPANLTLEIKVEEETKRPNKVMPLKSRVKRSLEVELEWIEGEESGSSGGGLTIA